MAEDNDQKTVRIDLNNTLPDMDSTVRLDLGSDESIVSISEDDEITPDDFDKTIEGLFSMDELINADSHSPDKNDEPTISFSIDDVNLDELDAGIHALSDNNSPDKNEPSTADIPPSPDTVENTNTFEDSGELYGIDEAPEKPADTSNESGDASSSTGIDELPLLDFPDDAENIHDSDVSDKQASAEPDKPHKPETIELTEDMLDKLESPVLNEVEQDNNADFASPSDTVTEASQPTHADISAGTAIKETAENEGHADEAGAPKQSGLPDAVASEPQSSSSNTLPVVLGLLGITAGGLGAWMAFDASQKVAEIQARLANLSMSKAAAGNKQNIAQIHQRLTKIERRLTGTPTLDAAAPLGSAATRQVDVPGTAKQPMPAATPTPAEKPMIAKPDAAKPGASKTVAKTIPAPKPVSADWVVNVSSHARKSLAIAEMTRLKKLGLNAELHQAQIKNRTWYRVQITGFASKNEAKAKLRQIEQKSGVRDAWIGKR